MFTLHSSIRVVKMFKDGREEVGDTRSGCPMVQKSEANVEKIHEINRKDRCLSIRAVAEFVDIAKESVRHMLHEKINK